MSYTSGVCLSVVVVVLLLLLLLLPPGGWVFLNLFIMCVISL